MKNLVWGPLEDYPHQKHPDTHIKDPLMKSWFVRRSCILSNLNQVFLTFKFFVLLRAS